MNWKLCEARSLPFTATVPMAESTETRLNRIVQLVAELSQAGGDGWGSIKELAESFGVSEQEIARDLEALGNASDNLAGSALANLAFDIQEGSVLAKSSRAFRRPLVLNRFEALALAVALGSEAEAGESLQRLLPRPVRAESFSIGSTLADGAEGSIGVFLTALQLRRCVEIQYVGARNATTVRVIHPRHVVQSDGATYIIAWCEKADEERHFRIERILKTTMLEREFAPGEKLLRPDSEEDLDNRSNSGEQVAVRFSPTIARWIKERHPDGEVQDDGSLVVELAVWNPEWLVQHVLQYGAEAEVLGPEKYREAMRHALE